MRKQYGFYKFMLETIDYKKIPVYDAFAACSMPVIVKDFAMDWINALFQQKSDFRLFQLQDFCVTFFDNFDKPRFFRKSV